jgi:hypothetical protein
MAEAWKPGGRAGIRRGTRAGIVGDRGDGGVIGVPSLRAMDRSQGARIWMASEVTDMRCGFDRLAERVNAVIGKCVFTHKAPGTGIVISRSIKIQTCFDVKFARGVAIAVGERARGCSEVSRRVVCVLTVYTPAVVGGDANPPVAQNAAKTAQNTPF